MKLSFDGSIKGQHTLDDLLAFYQACRQLGMPGTATIEGATKLLGHGPLKTITANWTEAPAGVVAPIGPADLPKVPAGPAQGASLVPGIPDDVTRPLPAVAPLP